MLFRSGLGSCLIWHLILGCFLTRFHGQEIWRRSMWQYLIVRNMLRRLMKHWKTNAYRPSHKYYNSTFIVADRLPSIPSILLRFLHPTLSSFVMHLFCMHFFLNSTLIISTHQRIPCLLHSEKGNPHSRRHSHG